MPSNRHGVREMIHCQTFRRAEVDGSAVGGLMFPDDVERIMAVYISNGVEESAPDEIAIPTTEGFLRGARVSG